MWDWSHELYVIKNYGTSVHSRETSCVVMFKPNDPPRSKSVYIPFPVRMVGSEVCREDATGEKKSPFLHSILIFVTFHLSLDKQI
jgi:hypothetical protein